MRNKCLQAYKIRAAKLNYNEQVNLSSILIHLVTVNEQKTVGTQEWILTSNFSKPNSGFNKVHRNIIIAWLAILLVLQSVFVY